jgi:OPA family glycerol-3-phosphate transporter-like MFS transporter
VVAPELSANGLLTVEFIGLMGSLFFVAYAVGELVNGFAGDRINPKYMILAGLTLIAASNLAIGLLIEYHVSKFWLIILWVSNGFAQSMLWGPILRLISVDTDDKRYSKMASLLSLSISVGSVVAYVVSALLLDVSLSAVFILPTLLLIMPAAGVIIFFPGKGAVNALKTSSKRVTFFKLLRSPKIALGIAPAFAHGIIKDTVLFWVPVFFATFFSGASKGMFLLYLALPPLMIFAGKLVYPLLYKLCRRREEIVSFLCFFLSGVLLLFLMFFNFPIPVKAVLLSGVLASMAAVNTSMLSIVPLHFRESGNVSMVAGIMDFITYTGAAVSVFILRRYISLESGFKTVVIVLAVSSVVTVAYYILLFIAGRVKDRRKRIAPTPEQTASKNVRVSDAVQINDLKGETAK